MGKKCSKCKEIKGVKEFSRDRSKTDGLTSACRECNNTREKKRRANGGDFTNEQKQTTFNKYGSHCQICDSTSDLQVDHKLAQIVCKPNKASIEENAWVLCKACNIAKGKKILLEVIRSIPGRMLGPMLLKEYANAIVQHKFKKVLITIGNKQFTEVQFKYD
ncbi:hypothetical protein COF46_21380 [Bacillus pseudomycoides]|uniref:hypothetical protein n=1 Tax=Bacillus pseudomycoides TaxID=64104 RepID=UPI000BF89E51|nr:hypothetical protein [Bacillus pseudomycoides]PFZ91888.1 hypothetical protein COL70_11625 [Bacillus pseudomycoides]PHD10278.1 hypothetical protein COF46_21380 [Bacillus pseudomycoides]